MSDPSQPAAQSTTRRRVLILLAAILLCVFGWHVYVSQELSRNFRSSQEHVREAGQDISVLVNPITNRVSMTITMPPDDYEGNPFAAFGAALGQTMVQAMTPKFEEGLNERARQKMDVYAVLKPYRVSISMEPASPEAAARMLDEKAQWEAQRAEEEPRAEAARLDSARAYVASNLTLERVRVLPGTQFGQTVTGVFGTVVNNGTDTLRKVVVRVYFLDSEGRRIGEKDFYPVLVTDSHIGDNTPLRPGYREDFGYSVEDDAPSGWAKKVETEIVDFDVLDEE